MSPDSETRSDRGTPRRRAFLVLGMHRSGTSALSRLLCLLGADLPSQTIGPDESNETGYWESPELYRCHEKLLASAGSSWDDWQPFARARLDAYDVNAFEQRLLDFLALNFANSTHFVVKDPRICRVVPLWLDLLNKFSSDPYAIIPIRNPIAVARSLHKRDGFSFAKSYLVWLRHIVDAELATRHIPRSFVDYDTLLVNWRHEIKRITSELGIVWPHALSDVEKSIEDYLSVQLRHHVAALGELEGSADVVSWIRRAHAAVEKLTRGGNSEMIRHELDQVRAEFDNACLAFGDVWRAERLNLTHAALHSLGIVSSRELEVQAAQLDRRISTLNTDIQKVAAQAISGGLQQTAEQLPGTTDVLTNHGEDTRETNGSPSLRSRLDHLAVYAEDLDAAIETLASTTKEQQVVLQELVAAAAQRITRLESAAATAEQHAILQELLTAAAQRIARLESAAAGSALQTAGEVERTNRLEARLTRLQWCIEGTAGRVDALTAQLQTSSSHPRNFEERGRTMFQPIHFLKRGLRLMRRIALRLIRPQWFQRYLAERHVQRDYRALRNSGVFDGEWYLQQYPDVAAAKQNPLLHYLRYGWAEGRNPSPLFETSSYLRAHPELRSTNCNPLAHWLKQNGTAGNSSTQTTAGVSPPSHDQPENGEQQPPPAPEVSEEPEIFPSSPLVSIVVPVYNTPAALLHKMIQSVQRQIYRNWELCLVDDASTEPHVQQILLDVASSDPRVRTKFRPANGNIAAATNEAIELAQGEFVAFLDHDDELTPDALLEVVRLLNDEPETDVIYTDQDKIDLHGRASEPFHKPAWSPAYLQSVMYIGHLLVVRLSLLRLTGGCDSAFDGVQDFELMLRLSEATKRIRHLPRILYHWRMAPGSIAADSGAKQGIADLQRKAVQAQLDRLGIPALATTSGTGHRVSVEPVARQSEPLISILIPTKDHPELIGPCLESLFEKTKYGTFEVILGDNETIDADALRIFERYPVTRLPLPGAFHFSAFNNRMAARARGEYLLLLNNDTQVIQPNWLETLLLHAEQDDVGAVGPVLLYGDRTIQHAGVILGPRGTADHLMRGFPQDADGYAGSLRAAREVTAVTGACLLVRRTHYVACGGLNEYFGRHYEDLDFCLQLRRRGLRNICVGNARMLHHESKSRGRYYDFTDRLLLLDRWEPWIQRGDPYYNPAFSRQSTDYSPGRGVR